MASISTSPPTSSPSGSSSSRSCRVALSTRRRSLCVTSAPGHSSQVILLHPVLCLPFQVEVADRRSAKHPPLYPTKTKSVVASPAVARPLSSPSPSTAALRTPFSARECRKSWNDYESSSGMCSPSYRTRARSMSARSNWFGMVRGRCRFSNRSLGVPTRRRCR